MSLADNIGKKRSTSFTYAAGASTRSEGRPSAALSCARSGRNRSPAIITSAAMAHLPSHSGQEGEQREGSNPAMGNNAVSTSRTSSLSRAGKNFMSMTAASLGRSRGSSAVSMSSAPSTRASGKQAPVRVSASSSSQPPTYRASTNRGANPNPPLPPRSTATPSASRKSSYGELLFTLPTASSSSRARERGQRASVSPATMQFFIDNQNISISRSRQASPAASVAATVAISAVTAAPDQQKRQDREREQEDNQLGQEVVVSCMYAYGVSAPPSLSQPADDTAATNEGAGGEKDGESDRDMSAVGGESPFCTIMSAIDRADAHALGNTCGAAHRRVEGYGESLKVVATVGDDLYDDDDDECGMTAGTPLFVDAVADSERGAGVRLFSPNKEGAPSETVHERELCRSVSPAAVPPVPLPDKDEVVVGVEVGFECVNSDKALDDLALTNADDAHQEPCDPCRPTMAMETSTVRRVEATAAHAFEEDNAHRIDNDNDNEDNNDNASSSSSSSSSRFGECVSNMLPTAVQITSPPRVGRTTSESASTCTSTATRALVPLVKMIDDRTNSGVDIITMTTMVEEGEDGMTKNDENAREVSVGSATRSGAPKRVSSASLTNCQDHAVSLSCRVGTPEQKVKVSLTSLTSDHHRSQSQQQQQQQRSVSSPSSAALLSHAQRLLASMSAIRQSTSIHARRSTQFAVATTTTTTCTTSTTRQPTATTSFSTTSLFSSPHSVEQNRSRTNKDEGEEGEGGVEKGGNSALPENRTPPLSMSFSPPAVAVGSDARQGRRVSSVSPRRVAGRLLASLSPISLREVRRRQAEAEERKAIAAETASSTPPSAPLRKVSRTEKEEHPAAVTTAAVSVSPAPRQRSVLRKDKISSTNNKLFVAYPLTTPATLSPMMTKPTTVAAVDATNSPVTDTVVRVPADLEEEAAAAQTAPEGSQGRVTYTHYASPSPACCPPETGTRERETENATYQDDDNHDVPLTSKSVVHHAKNSIGEKRGRSSGHRDAGEEGKCARAKAPSRPSEEVTKHQETGAEYFDSQNNNSNERPEHERRGEVRDNTTPRSAAPPFVAAGPSESTSEQCEQAQNSARLSTSPAPPAKKAHNVAYDGAQNSVCESLAALDDSPATARTVGTIQRFVEAYLEDEMTIEVVLDEEVREGGGEEVKEDVPSCKNSPPSAGGSKHVKADPLQALAANREAREKDEKDITGKNIREEIERLLEIAPTEALLEVLEVLRRNAATTSSSNDCHGESTHADRGDERLRVKIEGEEAQREKEATGDMNDVNQKWVASNEDVAQEHSHVRSDNNTTLPKKRESKEGSRKEESIRRCRSSSELMVSQSAAESFSIGLFAAAPATEEAHSSKEANANGNRADEGEEEDNARGCC